MAVGIARVILYEFGAASEGQARSTTQRVSTKWLRCRMQRLYRVVQCLSGKYRFEPEVEIAYESIGKAVLVMHAHSVFTGELVR